MLDHLRADLTRYLDDGGHPLRTTTDWLHALKNLVETQGVWALAVFRFGQWSYQRAPRPVAPPCKIAYQLLHKLVEVATGISLPARACVGKGFYIGHFGGIIIHPDAVIGEGVNISHGVTIGVLGRDRPGVPRIGNGVYIGAGAKILGAVSVGDGAAIGANAVVLHDVPAGATAVGVPAKIVRREARVTA